MINLFHYLTRICALVCLLCTCSPQLAFCRCDEQCPPLDLQDEKTWKAKLRVNALRNFDQLLSWSTSEKLKTYPLAYPLREERIEEAIPEVTEFAEKYGYFSLMRPIVSHVTANETDVDLICCALKALHDKGAKGNYLEIAMAELVAKALAYRDLKIGQAIRIPVESQGEVTYESYSVEKVFNIWHGMPAFGLVPSRQGLAAILLFRGTELSLISSRGWASIMSDLDMAGPGLSAFRHAQGQISAWLLKMKQRGKAAKVMGCSLGGTLAAYTFIYENDLLAEGGSIGVCPAGVSDEVIESWNQISPERQKGWVAYVYTGDPVSHVGKLFGTVYCLTATRPLKPLTAHTFLMSGEESFSKALVDVSQRH